MINNENGDTDNSSNNQSSPDNAASGQQVRPDKIQHKPQVAEVLRDGQRDRKKDRT
jgi:hypothetical protein